MKMFLSLNVNQELRDCENWAEPADHSLSLWHDKESYRLSFDDSPRVSISFQNRQIDPKRLV